MMKHRNFLAGLRPSKLAAAIAERGVAGTACHAVRRAGTLAERAAMGPALIRINPMGYVCNHTCPMCWLQHLEPDFLAEMKKRDRQEGMKLEDYERFFDGMTHGLEEINVVGGGEPLVHPEATQIFRAIKRHGWFGSLITNGTLLREQIAEALVDMKWDAVRISTHAGDAETYRKIQGVDRFDILLKNLRTFDRLRRQAPEASRTELGLFHVIQKDNVGSIDLLFKVAEEVGADTIEFDPVIPYDEGMRMSAEEIHHAREQIALWSRLTAIPNNGEEIVQQLRVEEDRALDGKPFIPAKRCSVGFDQSFITAEGDVLPCCFSDEKMGNVREQSFREIWYGDKYTKFRERLINGKFAKYCITNRCTLPGVLHH